MSTRMILLEFPDLSEGWECEACGAQFKATRKFERSATCPACGEAIKEWVEWEEED